MAKNAADRTSKLSRLSGKIRMIISENLRFLFFLLLLLLANHLLNFLLCRFISILLFFLGLFFSLLVLLKLPSHSFEFFFVLVPDVDSFTFLLLYFCLCSCDCLLSLFLFSLFFLLLFFSDSLLFSFKL